MEVATWIILAVLVAALAYLVVTGYRSYQHRRGEELAQRPFGAPESTEARITSSRATSGYRNPAPPKRP
jgi:hypothetical protein